MLDYGVIAAHSASTTRLNAPSLRRSIRGWTRRVCRLQRIPVGCDHRCVTPERHRNRPIRSAARHASRFPFTWQDRRPPPC